MKHRQHLRAFDPPLARSSPGIRRLIESLQREWIGPTRSLLTQKGALPTPTISDFDDDEDAIDEVIPKPPAPTEGRIRAALPLNRALIVIFSVPNWSQ